LEFIKHIRNIHDSINRIIAFRDARDWKQFHNPKDVAISLVLEAGELTKHFQWKSKEEIEVYYEEQRGD
jgi:dCTP diphosphatase